VFRGKKKRGECREPRKGVREPPSTQPTDKYGRSKTTWWGTQEKKGSGAGEGKKKKRKKKLVFKKKGEGPDCMNGPAGSTVHWEKNSLEKKGKLRCGRRKEGGWEMLTLGGGDTSWVRTETPETKIPKPREIEASQ